MVEFKVVRRGCAGMLWAEGSCSAAPEEGAQPDMAQGGLVPSLLLRLQLLSNPNL